MVYIDSDGVLADFKGWVNSYGEDIIKDDAKLSKLMFDNYKDCFLMSKPFSNIASFISEISLNPNYFVLTAAPSIDRIFNYLKDINETIKVFNTLKENKYEWYKKLGVPRHKIIIVEHSIEKLKYCGKGDTLFDDYPKTIKYWVEKGGNGILVNRNKGIGEYSPI